ncbi:hypothetical protein [Thermaurantiacus sp.]
MDAELPAESVAIAKKRMARLMQAARIAGVNVLPSSTR